MGVMGRKKKEKTKQKKRKKDGGPFFVINLNLNNK
jgi:hypothetical protein